MAGGLKDRLKGIKGEDWAIVNANLDRYRYVKSRGHHTYIKRARKLEDMYLGGGLQWDKATKRKMNGRPTVEKNFIWPAVNTACGLQTQTRADMAFKPRKGGASEETAEVLSKLVRQIGDDIKYPWLESQVYSDGMIQQRGYLDFRITFDTNMLGDIVCRDVDPMDVMPDPDSGSYDPEHWADLIIPKWLSIDQISQYYGQDKADEVDTLISESMNDPDDDYQWRSRFGDSVSSFYRGGDEDTESTRYVMVIERQHRRLERQKVLVYPYGDIVPVNDMSPEKLSYAQDQEGAYLAHRMKPRIRWTVTTCDVLLHDEWSPYRTFTIIPFFPYFRRGRTRGMVDNAVSPQEQHNKYESQITHILGTTANSGWLVPTGSLVNMTVPQLQNVGAKTGLVIEYDVNKGPPTKIEPNKLPTGLDRLVERSEFAIKSITGISDAVQGGAGPEISGVAKNAAQYAGQTQLAGPADNLARTRNGAAKKILELVQDFYTEERVVMITEQDYPEKVYSELAINQASASGEIINDLTIGEYDVIVTDQPVQSTFAESQFTQAMDMRRDGIQIDDAVVLEYSSLSKKNEIIADLRSREQEADPEAEAKADESISKAELNRANTEKVKAETVDTNIKTQYSAVQSAGVIVQQPGIAPIADTLLKSGGYIDHDLPPIVPNAQGMLTPEAPPMPVNTNPLTPAPIPAPASPAMGQTSGIETQRFDDNL